MFLKQKTQTIETQLHQIPKWSLQLALRLFPKEPDLKQRRHASRPKRQHALQQQWPQVTPLEMHEGHDGECDEELLDLFGDFERVIFFVCCVDFGYVAVCNRFELG